MRRLLRVSALMGWMSSRRSRCMLSAPSRKTRTPSCRLRSAASRTDDWKGYAFCFAGSSLSATKTTCPHRREVRVRGGMPVHALQHLRVADRAVLTQPCRADRAVEQDGRSPLDGVDGDAETLRLLDEHTSGDVAGDVVRCGGEVGGRRVEGMGHGEFAGDASHTLDVSAQAVREGVEPRGEDRREVGGHGRAPRVRWFDRLTMNGSPLHYGCEIPAFAPTPRRFAPILTFPHRGGRDQTLREMFRLRST